MSNDKNTVSLTISDMQAETLLSALKLAHSVVSANFGNMSDLPDFRDCTIVEYEKIVVRTFKALSAHCKQKEEAAFKGARAATESIIRDARVEGRKALKEFSDLLAANPTLAALLKNNAPADHVDLPLPTFADCFSEGTTTEQIVNFFKSGGYSVVKGKENKDVLKVRVSLTPDAKKETSEETAQAAE